MITPGRPFQLSGGSRLFGKLKLDVDPPGDLEMRYPSIVSSPSTSMDARFLKVIRESLRAMQGHASRQFVDENKDICRVDMALSSLADARLGYEARAVVEEAGAAGIPLDTLIDVLQLLNRNCRTEGADRESGEGPGSDAEVEGWHDAPPRAP